MCHLRGGEDLRNTSEGIHFWAHQVPAKQSSWRPTLSWPRIATKPPNTTALPPCTCAGRSCLLALQGSVAETQHLLHVPCKGDKVQMSWGQHRGQQIDNVVQVYRKKEIIQIEWAPHRKDNSTCSCEQWPHQANTGQRMGKFLHAKPNCDKLEKSKTKIRETLLRKCRVKYSLLCNILTIDFFADVYAFGIL